MLLFYQKEGLIMCATMPIKGSKKLTMFRNYYKNVQYNPRNYALIVLGLNSALRISDILSLRWKDVYQNSKKKYRSQAFQVIKKAAIYCGLDQGGSCHSLRKTFGYYAWQHGTPLAMLMNIFNHSSYDITKRYLGIEQAEKMQHFITKRCIFYYCI